MKTAQQAAANWVNSAGRAQQGYVAGIQNYNGDWAQATISQEQTMVQNFQQAIAAGDFRRGVAAIGTTGWKAAAEAKQANYGVGFNAGAARQAVAIGKIMNALGTIVPNLPARGTYEQNKIRATTLMDALHAQRGQLGAT
jgi:hypothetical protein